MTTKAEHTAALVRALTRGTAPDGVRLEVLEAVDALGGDDVPTDWRDRLDAARDLEARRQASRDEVGAPDYDDVPGSDK